MDVKTKEILEGLHPNYPTGKLKERLLKFKLLEYKCSKCGICEWNGKFISLQLDHIDGNSKNHLFENLRLLCPNCHAQTDTYAGKNIKFSKFKVSDDEILDSLKNNKTILSAINSLGMSKGGNYSRFVKIAKNNNLDSILKNLRNYHISEEKMKLLYDIDYSKYGWVGKVSKIVGISPQKARKWIQNNAPELLNNAKLRKKPM